MKRVFGYLFVPVYWLAKAVSLFCVRLRFKIIKRRVNGLKLSQEYGDNDAE
jgi:hypothetical protein